MQTRLKIAFISFEYPPDTSGGGIGTYTKQVSSILREDNHAVFVFCGATKDSYEYEENGIMIYRINANSSHEFRNRILDTFKAKHHTIRFDVIESPDYGADGYFIKKEFPLLPYIVKLHTPTYLLREFNNHYKQYIYPKKYLTRIKSSIKKLLEHPVQNSYNYKQDIEYLNVNLADLIVSPSESLAKRISRQWKIKMEKIIIVPNPYISIKELLAIPLEYNSNRITFIGKLSFLKGIFDFIDAIPIVLKKNPSLQFRFIGEDSFSPEQDKTMSEYLISRNHQYKSNIEFTGKVRLDDIPKYLAETDVVVCNSLWENYPTVILEAMSAGRIVIGSKVGGIPEIIVHQKNGLLVGSKNAKDLAEKILWVYSNKLKVREIGHNAKSFIEQNSGSNVLAKKIIHSYQLAITK